MAIRSGEGTGQVGHKAGVQTSQRDQGGDFSVTEVLRESDVLCSGLMDDYDRHLLRIWAGSTIMYT